MGQEISQQQNKCNNIRRLQEQQNYKHPHFKSARHQQQQQQNCLNCNEKYTKHKDLIYTPSNISSSSISTDDEHYRQRQRYNLSKQTYEKSKVSKKLSLTSNTTVSTASTATNSTSGYQSTSVGSNHRNSSSDTSIYEKYTPTTQGLFTGKQQQPPQHKQQYQHQRRDSQGTTDSGIYYSSCHCASSSSANSVLSSAASTTSGCSSSVLSQHSNKSLVKQKKYLSNHLYIKSYLDILEEDEKAKAHFKSARPGGIRNYTPKILADSSSLSSSAPASRSGTKSKDDQWI